MTDQVNEAVAWMFEQEEYGEWVTRLSLSREAGEGEGKRNLRPLTHPARGVVDAEDRFEQYVATLIAKNPDVRKLGERLADWLDEDRFNTINPILLGIAQRLSAQPAVPSVPEDGWQPIETIPRDESRVELLSANGKTDNGRWCNRPDWVGHTDDIQDYLDTDNGEGSYTHWRPLAATPKDQPAQTEGGFAPIAPVYPKEAKP